MKTRCVREVVWQRNAKAERWGSWRRSPDEQRDSSLLEIVAMADKVYLTPTPGSSGHRGGGGEEEEEAETLFRLQTVVTGKYLESCEETG